MMVCTIAHCTVTRCGFEFPRAGGGGRWSAKMGRGIQMVRKTVRFWSWKIKSHLIRTMQVFLMEHFNVLPPPL